MVSRSGAATPNRVDVNENGTLRFILSRQSNTLEVPSPMLGLNTFLIPPKLCLCWIRAMYRQTCFCLLTSKALWDLGLSWVHYFFDHMCQERNLATLTVMERPL